MEPLLVKKTNLSGAWCTTLNHILNHKGIEITPLLISITDFGESSDVRETLDAHLKASGMATIQTVSETIFPQSLYQLCNYDRKDLYNTYLEILPRIKAIDKLSNGRGTYFERLIAYDGETAKINQLENIILSLNSNNNRRSKLQASVFNPSKDHSEGFYQKFPCLQHVTFYKSENGGLILNGFYAVQYLYQRAYGNWLGLINLGKFVAKELGLEFERFNCYMGVEKLDEINKIEAKSLLEKTNFEP